MSSLKLSFLGRPVVTVDGEAVPLKPRKVLALLAYLGVTLGRYTRDGLAELLYPRQDRARARAGVRQSLSILRQALGADWIRTDGDAVWLDQRRGLSIDVQDVRRLAGRYAGAGRAGDSAGSRRALEQLEGLFRGDFLSGFYLKDAAGFESWQRSMEESLRAEHADILERLAALHLDAKRLEQAIDYARRWLVLDPTDEAGHRALIRAYALCGKRADALRQYERCREVLQSELGAAPDAETERLHEEVARGEVASEAPSGELPADLRPPPGNLRSPPTAFVGRESELQEVVDALLGSEVRLLTITGPAGTGKTRLALECARRVLPRYPNGAFFVDLSVLREPADVLPTVGSVLGVYDPRGSTSPPFDLVREFLRNSRLLLVLDNFEHLLAASDSVARLIAECPRLTVLATSREALRVQAENEYLLSPLRLPSRGEDPQASEAVRLFVERARAARHGFALSKENADAVLQICARLDGLPLAIELAAARTRFLPPGKLLSLLESKGLDLLSGGSRDMPARHQTLRRAIEWSHDLLDASEGALLRRLSVFSGGCTLEAADSVCRTRPEEDILAGLESLVDKSLLFQTTWGGEPWYEMLVTIHQFAGERLEESGEGGTVRERHARHYLEMVETAEPELDRSAGTRWAERLALEYSNIRAAVSWSTEHAIEIALRIASALERFCSIQGHWREAQGWLERALTRSRDPRVTGLDRCRAKAFAALSSTTLGPRSAASSIAAAQEGLALWRTVGDRRGQAYALMLIGLARMFDAHDPAAVLPLLEESASLQRDLDERMGLAHTLFWLAYVTLIQGDRGKARRMAAEDIHVAREAGDVIRVAGATGLLGQISVEEGDLAGAQSLVEQSLALYRETKDTLGLYHQLSNLGGIALLRGNFDQARSCYTEALGVWDADRAYSPFVGTMCFGFVYLRQNLLEQALSSFREGMSALRTEDARWARQCLAACAAGAAAVDVHQGRSARAARILGGVEPHIRVPFARLAWGHNVSITPTLMRLEVERIMAEVRAAMGDSASAAIAEGRALSLEQAMDLALQTPATPAL